MNTFCFTVDDNIRFLKEITEKGYGSIFDHPYLAVYERLHERFGLKVQLNLFYRMAGFDLSMMPDRYAPEWRANADWLKLSFHSEYENEWPYVYSGYDEVYKDCADVDREILRFSSLENLAKTTTVHYCSTTEDGVRALKDNGVGGLLGLFGTDEAPTCSYALPEDICARVRMGEILFQDGMAYAPIDLILNKFSCEEAIAELEKLLHREHLWIMIHEQYFYDDYHAYQPEFEEKLIQAVSFFHEHGYESRFFEELLA